MINLGVNTGSHSLFIITKLTQGGKATSFCDFTFSKLFHRIDPVYDDLDASCDIFAFWLQELKAKIEKAELTGNE